jgi:hypothetical protein
MSNIYFRDALGQGLRISRSVNKGAGPSIGRVYDGDEAIPGVNGAALVAYTAEFQTGLGRTDLKVYWFSRESDEAVAALEAQI